MATELFEHMLSNQLYSATTHYCGLISTLQRTQASLKSFFGSPRKYERAPGSPLDGQMLHVHLLLQKQNSSSAAPAELLPTGARQ